MKPEEIERERAQLAELIATTTKKADEADDDMKKNLETALSPETEIELKVWFHPDSGIPFEFDAEVIRFKGTSSTTILEMAYDVDEFFQEYSEKAGRPMQFRIKTIWNTKDNKKAFPTTETLGMHFESGDKFGVHGEVLPIEYEESEESDSDEFGKKPGHM